MGKMDIENHLWKSEFFVDSEYVNLLNVGPTVVCDSSLQSQKK